MKTIEKISQKKALLFTCCLMLVAEASKASSFINTIKKEFANVNPIGIYIIVGVLTVGIIAYFITSYIESKQPKDEAPTNIRHINTGKEHHYGHHHHQHVSQHQTKKTG